MKFRIVFEFDPAANIHAPFWAKSYTEDGKLLFCSSGSSYEDAEQRATDKLKSLAELAAVPVPSEKAIEVNETGSVIVL